jgi:hypothetical protein
MYMGHQMWLILFDSEVETQVKRIVHEIYTMLNDWEWCPKKEKKQKQIALELMCKVWKTKSIFF